MFNISVLYAYIHYKNEFVLLSVSYWHEIKEFRQIFRIY